MGVFDGVFKMNSINNTSNTNKQHKQHKQRLRHLLLCLGAALLPAAPAMAHEYYATSFTIVHPWALPTEAGGNTAAVYLKFEEISAGDRLVAAHAGMAQQVALRGAAAIDLAAGTSVELKPGTAYLELTGLKAPLQSGRSYPMTLQFETSGPIQVMVSIGAH